MLRPSTLAAAAMVALQMPVLARHRLTGTTSVTGTGSFVVGSLPGQTQDTVRILCIEVEPVAALAAR